MSPYWRKSRKPPQHVRFLRCRRQSAPFPTRITFNSQNNFHCGSYFEKLLPGKSRENASFRLTSPSSCAIIHPASGAHVRSTRSIVGYSQAVRQGTLTPSFRWFESSYPSQIPEDLFSGIYFFTFHSSLFTNSGIWQSNK